MARVLLDNFKGGIDTTRPEIVASPSTMVSAINVDISRGGDIVKAKALASRYTLPANTFGLASEGANLVVFGSVAAPTMPAGVVYQRLQHSDSSTAMAKVLWAEKFDGKLYVIAQFADGQIFHYYDGTRITDWDSIQTAISSLDQIAANMASLITAGSTAASATSSGAVVTITGRTAGDDYVISKSTTNVTAGTNDQDITLASVTAAAAATAETAAIGSFRLSQSGSGGEVSDVTVNGVTVMASAVSQQATTQLTAQAVVDKINATDDIDYTASLVGTDTVRLTAVSGIGDSANGHTVAVTVVAPVTVSDIVDITGGVDAVAAVSQVDTATMSGTVESGDIFELTIDGETFTVNTAIGFVGAVAKTLQNKVYSTVGSLLRFSGVATPEGWVDDAGPPVVAGAGFINMSNQDGGSEDLVGLGIYQSRLAVLSRNSTQIWVVDSDPDLNQQQQVIPNIGTFAPKSVQSFGDIDLFFLSDKGVRSLRVRDSSTFAAVNDVGTSIDSLIIAHLATLSDSVSAAAVAAVDPLDGRYLLAVGSRMFTYSFFPSTKVAGWTEYNPGFTVSDMVVLKRGVFARSGDTVYQLGGADGTTYANGATVVLPWVDANSVASWKFWQGMDLVCEGEWAVYAATDPGAPESYQLIANVDGTTIGKGRIPVDLHSPVVKLKFVNTGTEYASISVATLWFKSAEDD